MEIITSTKNQYVRQAKSLAERKFRLQTGLFLAEGINLIKDMPCDVSIQYILATEDCALQAQNLAAEHITVEKTTPKVYYVTDEVMKYLADTVTPYGIAAVCNIPREQYELPQGNALLLDGVSDPGNIGTILRTAAACEFNTVYFLDTADAYSPKVVRASLGGIFKVKTVVVDETQAIELVRSTQSAVLDMNGVDLTKQKIIAPVLIVAGSEAHGVRAVLKTEAKSVISLPMKNNIESLNVAVATAVAMYQTI